MSCNATHFDFFFFIPPVICYLYTIIGMFLSMIS
nr:MAG TPA: hypothetical protein [Caudoviricetes sp.]